MFKKFLLLITFGLSCQTILPVKIQTGSNNANHEFIADGGTFELSATELSQLKSVLIDGIIEDTALGDWPAIQLPINKQTFALLKNILGDTQEFNVKRTQNILHESTVAEFLPLLHALCFLNTTNTKLCRVVAKHYLEIQQRISFDQFAQHAQYITLFFQQDCVKELLAQAATPYTLLQTFTGHTNEITSIAFSPDGTKLATGSWDHTAKLWDVTTSQCLQTLTGHRNWINSVAFSQDGTKLATGSSDHTAKLWDVATSQCLQTLTEHPNTVCSVKLSPDGTKLATGYNDCTARLWDVKTGECIQTFTGHNDRIRSVVFSPDGTKIATGSDDRTARLWEVSSGQCLQILNGHTGWVDSVSFSPDGTKLATGSDDCTAKLWAILDIAQQMLLIWAMKNTGKFTIGVLPFLDEVYASLPEQLQQKIMTTTGV